MGDGTQRSQPWVILVHGIRSCKANHEVLIPAAWLHQAGFNVVLFDMRDHGESTVEDGLVSAGQREYRDILAVWQWIQDEKDVLPERIGALGISLGAGALPSPLSRNRSSNPCSSNRRSPPWAPSSRKNSNLLGSRVLDGRCHLCWQGLFR